MQECLIGGEIKGTLLMVEIPVEQLARELDKGNGD